MSIKGGIHDVILKAVPEKDVYERDAFYRVQPLSTFPIQLEFAQEAAWPSGQRVGLAIRRSRVRVPLWPLAGFVLGRPEFKFSATLVNSQLVAFCQLGFLILLCYI